MVRERDMVRARKGSKCIRWMIVAQALRNRISMRTSVIREGTRLYLELIFSTYNNWLSTSSIS